MTDEQPLPGRGDEVQIQVVGFGAQAQSDVGDTGGDGEGDLGVGRKFRAMHGVRGDSGGEEQSWSSSIRVPAPTSRFGDPQRGEIGRGTGVRGWGQLRHEGRGAATRGDVRRRRDRSHRVALTGVFSEMP